MISAMDAAASPGGIFGPVMVPEVTGRCDAARLRGAAGAAGAAPTGLTSVPIGRARPSCANPQFSSFDA